MLNAPLSFQPLELDFHTLNLDNLARVHDTLPHPQRLDDNLNFTRSPPLTNLLLFAFLPQNMPGNRTIAPEINIANNWHNIPTSGDLLANDTNDLAHFLSLHPFGSWLPKAPPRLNLQVTSSSMTEEVTLTGCDLIPSITFLVMVVFLTAKGCESTPKAMPNACFSSGIFAALLHILFLHDLYPFPEMFLTRRFWKILDLALTYLCPTNQAQHQQELDEYGPYDSILVDGEQRQIPFTLGDLSDPPCPGYEHCCGVVGTMLKGANTAVKLHNCNVDNSLPTEVHASVTDFLTSSDNKILHDEVVEELEAPPCNLIWTGLGNDCHGANVQDPYLYTFIRDFHIKMASLLGLTPLPLLGRLHNSLVKPIFFSPLLQNLWSHLAVLAVPAGTFWLFPCPHSLPLECTDFSPLYPDSAYFQPPRCFMVDSPLPPYIFRPCTTTGRRSLPKGRNAWMTLANLPQDNCFMPLPKPTGTDNGYFTIGMLPPALSIPCKIAPDFAKFKEVTTTNTNLLSDMLTEFQLALVATGKSGAVAVYPPLVLDFPAIFVPSSFMAFHLFSADPPCVPSYDVHVSIFFGRAFLLVHGPVFSRLSFILFLHG